MKFMVAINCNAGTLDIQTDDMNTTISLISRLANNGGWARIVARYLGQRFLKPAVMTGLRTP